jgi:hypothetical protein
MREEVERAVGTGHETIEAGADEDGCFHGGQLLLAWRLQTNGRWYLAGLFNYFRPLIVGIVPNRSFPCGSRPRSIGYGFVPVGVAASYERDIRARDRVGRCSVWPLSIAEIKKVASHHRLVRPFGLSGIAFRFGREPCRNRLRAWTVAMGADFKRAGPETMFHVAAYRNLASVEPARVCEQIAR